MVKVSTPGSHSVAATEKLLFSMLCSKNHCDMPCMKQQLLSLQPIVRAGLAFIGGGHSGAAARRNELEAAYNERGQYVSRRTAAAIGGAAHSKYTNCEIQTD